MTNAQIVASGWYVPEEILDNSHFVRSQNNPYLVYIGENSDGTPQFKDERFQITEENILQSTGITTRRRVAENETLVDMAANAFKRSGFDAKLLDAIITATISDEQRFPSRSCAIQARIGAKSVIKYTEDVVAACSGFTHAIDHARYMIEDPKSGIEYAMVVGVEALTRYIDETERQCILFGDGCGLVILGRTNDSERGILATNFLSDASGLDLIYKDKTQKLRMPQGNRVFKMAVNTMINVAHGAMEKCGVSKDDVNFYVPHQANGRILDKMGETIDPNNTGKIIRTVDIFGNMSSATEPVAYAKAREEGRIKEGDLVVWTDFASGIVSGSLVERV